MNRINKSEKVMKYYLMPSLQHISAVSITITLWRQSGVQHHAFNHSGYDGQWVIGILQMRKQISHEVLGGISQLPVPNHIRKISSDNVNTIGVEICKFIKVLENYVLSDLLALHRKPLEINCLDDLVWTSRGRIDYKRTAKNLLDHAQLSNFDRYDLACNYCLEDDIAVIAPNVIDTLVLVSLEKQAMVHFWTSRITGDFTESIQAVNSYNMQNGTNYSMNEIIFKSLIGRDINEVAIKYVWDKLSNEEKSKHCVSAITQSSSIDIHCFILSQLNEEQQQGVFKTYAKKILLNLLDDLLWSEYFLPTLYHIWNIINEGHFLDILKQIVYRMVGINHDIEKYVRYRATFKEAWQGAPAHLKDYVLEHDNGSWGRTLFFRLLSEKNEDIIKSILSYCNYIQKKNIIFSGECMSECRLIINNNQWNLLDMFMEHAHLSEDDVDHFKKKFVEAKGEFIVLDFMRSKEWDKVEQFEKWAFKSDSERKEFRQGFNI